MKFGGVLLIVKDINKSKKFYEDVMEQKITLDLGEHVSLSMESVIKRLLKQGLALEEISKRTMYPVEFITQFQQL
ncbi:hypothetical protein L9Z04_06650 [Clostridioides difficile]|nr:hypothetical protein [Clostridioides difficile]